MTKETIQMSTIAFTNSLGTFAINNIDKQLCANIFTNSHVRNVNIV